MKIHHKATPEPIATALQIQEEPAIPEPILETRKASPPRRVTNGVETGEYPSPAFIKRARVSYGALLETDFDELEDDGGVKGKGRKKPRFSIGGSRWRYQSATPSPEPETRESATPGSEIAESEARSPPPSKSLMTDEGCQTVEADLTPLPYVTPTPSGRDSFQLGASSPLERHAMADIFGAHADMGVQTQQTIFSNVPTTQQEDLIQNIPASYSFDHQQPIQTPALIPSQDKYNMPRFQAAMADPHFGEPEMTMGDQVRFGFSHVPQPIYAPVRDGVVEQNSDQVQDAYPTAYLEHSSAPHQPGVMHDSFGTGGHIQQDHYALGPQQTEQEHPERRKSSGQQELLLWPIDAQTMDYEHAVAHVDVDAPIPAQDGHHPIKDDLRSNGSEPDEEPLADNEEESDELRAQRASEQPLYRQGEVEEPALAGPENDLQEEEEGISSEEEADYDEDQVGDDYDMRNYADVEDDEEGFESQEEDGPLPDEELIDEEEGSYDDDEEGSYDEDDEDEEVDDRGPQRMPLYYAPPSRGPPAPAQSSAPVVIDLISDSEDEDDNVQTAITPSNQYDGPSEIQARRQRPEAVPAANFQSLDRSPPVPEESPHSIADLKEESPSYEVESENGSEDAEDLEESGASDNSEQEDSDLADADESEDEEVEGEQIITLEEANIDVEAKMPSPTSDALPTEHEADALITGELSEHIERPTNPQHPSSPGATILQREIVQELQDSADADHDVTMTDSAQDADTQATETHPTELQDLEMADGNALAQQAVQVGLDIAQEIQDASLMVRTFDRAQDDDQLLPSSPPMTQQTFESQVISKELFLPTGFESSQPMVDDDGDQLPTPNETQLPDKLDFLPPSVEEEAEPQLTGEVTASSGVILLSPAEGVPGPSQTAVEDTSIDEVSQNVDISEQQIRSEVVLSTVTEDPEEETAADTEMANETIQPKSSDDQDQHVNDVSDNLDTAREPESPPPDEGAIQVSNEKTPMPEAVSAPENQDILEDQRGLASAPASGAQKAENQDTIETVEVKQVSPEDKAEQDGPAAGTRRLRSRAPPPPPVDPSIQLARAAIASKRGKRATEQAPISPRTTRTRSMSFQKSATPEAEDTSVQLARAALKSPSKRKHESLAEQLRSDLSKRLPVEMPDCMPLKLLWSHHNKELDVAAVATTKSTDPSRAKGGPRQYIMSFNVTDPSAAPSEVVEVHFFRAHKDFLPAIKPGDAVLLRGFTVTSLKDKGFGLRSHDDSSWAVFEKDDGLAQVRGPPIELNDDEVDYMTTLKKWYAALDKPSQTQLEKANQKFAEANRAK